MSNVLPDDVAVNVHGFAFVGLYTHEQPLPQRPGVIAVLDVSEDGSKKLIAVDHIHDLSRSGGQDPRWFFWRDTAVHQVRFSVISRVHGSISKARRSPMPWTTTPPMLNGATTGHTSPTSIRFSEPSALNARNRSKRG